MLNVEERDQLSHALNAWLLRHPTPDEPVYRLAGDGALSPRQVVKEVDARSETGLAILEILEYSVRRSSLEDVVASFDRKLPA